MSIINVGSINIDHVYRVRQFTAPGETNTALSYNCGLGGKGLNQSVAIERAGAEVYHVGAIARNDDATAEALGDLLQHRDGFALVEQATGHAIIEIDSDGENRIIIYPGANHCLKPESITVAINSRKPSYLLCQNETNLLGACFDIAKSTGIPLVFSPAPCTPDLSELPLELATYIVCNEIELSQLAGNEDYEAAVNIMRTRCPQTQFVITLGEAGVEYIGVDSEIMLPAEQVAVIDTTAAGDTFLGYFIAQIDLGKTPIEALDLANRAAALCVTRAGAVEAIPTITEL